MAHVRERGCCCASFARVRCGGGMHAHHQRQSGGGGMGLKPDDTRTVPLCDAHHREFHKTGAIHPFNAATTALLFAQAMVECLESALQSELKL